MKKIILALIFIIICQQVYGLTINSTWYLATVGVTYVTNIMSDGSQCVCIYGHYYSVCDNDCNDALIDEPISVDFNVSDKDPCDKYYNNLLNITNEEEFNEWIDLGCESFVIYEGNIFGMFCGGDEDDLDIWYSNIKNR